MNYLDANIFIYAAIDETEIGDKCRDILKITIGKEKNAFTSCLTWDEVVYGIRKKRDKENSIEQGKNLFNLHSLRWLKVEETIIKRAQELIEHYSLKPRDAIHAATAIVNGIKEIISDDPDFDKVKELKRKSP